MNRRETSTFPGQELEDTPIGYKVSEVVTDLETDTFDRDHYFNRSLISWRDEGSNVRGFASQTLSGCLLHKK